MGSRHGLKISMAISIVVLAGLFGICRADWDWSAVWTFNNKGAMTSEFGKRLVTLHLPFEARHLDFSPDGKYLAASSLISDTDEDKKIYIWDWRNEKVVKTLLRPSLSNAVLATDGISWSPDGRFLAACIGGIPNHSIVRVWETVGWSVVHDFAYAMGGMCRSLKFSTDSHFLISLMAGGDFRGTPLVVYETGSWKESWRLRLPATFWPAALAVSKDGRYSAFVGASMGPGTLPEIQIHVADNLERRLVESISAISTDNNDVFSAAYSADGKQVAFGRVVGAGEVALQVWNIERGKVVHAETPMAPSRVVSLRYTPDGRYFIVSELDGRIKFFSTQTMALKQEIRGKAASLAVSRDSRYVAGGGDGKIIVWEVK